MSKVAISGSSSGTATYTIQSPSGSTDRVLTLPDATGTVLVSGQPVTATTGNFSGDVTLGSSVLATPTGSAPSYTCRAWVNFNGTGTVAIRASGNVSSITDNGTGDYTVNFTTAMPDVNYAPNAICSQSSGSGFNAMSVSIVSLTASSARLISSSNWISGVSNGAPFDPTVVSATIFR